MIVGSAGDVANWIVALVNNRQETGCRAAMSAIPDQPQVTIRSCSVRFARWTRPLALDSNWRRELICVHLTAPGANCDMP